MDFYHFLSKNTAHSRKLPEHAPCPITFPVLKQPVRVLNPLTACCRSSAPPAGVAMGPVAIDQQEGA